MKTNETNLEKNDSGLVENLLFWGGIILSALVFLFN